MQRHAFKVVLEAARQAKITVDTVATGVNRVSASIAGRTYASKTAALDAITTQYLKNQNTRR